MVPTGDRGEKPPRPMWLGKATWTLGWWLLMVPFLLGLLLMREERAFRLLVFGAGSMGGILMFLGLAVARTTDELETWSPLPRLLSLVALVPLGMSALLLLGLTGWLLAGVVAILTLLPPWGPRERPGERVAERLVRRPRLSWRP